MGPGTIYNTFGQSTSGRKQISSLYTQAVWRRRPLYSSFPWRDCMWNVSEHGWLSMV